MLSFKQKETRKFLVGFNKTYIYYISNAKCIEISGDVTNHKFPVGYNSYRMISVARMV